MILIITDITGTLEKSRIAFIKDYNYGAQHIYYKELNDIYENINFLITFFHTFYRYKEV